MGIEIKNAKTQHRFEELEVWKRAHEYVLSVYKLIQVFPPGERYSLTDQLRRSASSVPTNIVEGNERNSSKEYVQFLYMAKASLAESQYQLLLARDLGYIEERQYLALKSVALEVGKMIIGIIKYLQKND